MKDTKTTKKAPRRTLGLKRRQKTRLSGAMVLAILLHGLLVSSSAFVTYRLIIPKPPGQQYPLEITMRKSLPALRVERKKPEPRRITRPVPKDMDETPVLAELPEYVPEYRKPRVTLKKDDRFKALRRMFLNRPIIPFEPKKKKRTGAVVVSPHPTGDNPAPDYPELARQEGMEGLVVLNALISTQGKCVDIIIIKSSGFWVLDEEAAGTVKKWNFAPMLENGSPVQGWVQVPIRFKLED